MADSKLSNSPVCTEYCTIPIDQESEKAGIKLDRLSDYTYSCRIRRYFLWILIFAEYFDSCVGRA